MREREGEEVKRKAGGEAKAGRRRKARTRGSGGEEAGSAAQGSGAQEMTGLDDKEMQRMLKEQLGKMTKEEREEFLEDVSSSSGVL